MKHTNFSAADAAQVEMPCGSVIDLNRPRSAGVLSPSELAFCRRENVPLAYDPVQIGWLPQDAIDDIDLVYAKKAPTAAPDGLAFRAWEPRHRAAFIALLDDPEVWTHLPDIYPAPLDADTADALIELSNTGSHHLVRAIWRHGQIVGQVRLLFTPDGAEKDAAEISYWLGRAHWGKGIGSKAVAAFSAQSFADHPQVNTLMARVHRDNGASEAILRKAGYNAKGADPKDGMWNIFIRQR